MKKIRKDNNSYSKLDYFQWLNLQPKKKKTGKVVSRKSESLKNLYTQDIWLKKSRSFTTPSFARPFGLNWRSKYTEANQLQTPFQIVPLELGQQKKSELKNITNSSFKNAVKLIGSSQSTKLTLKINSIWFVLIAPSLFFFNHSKEPFGLT